MRWLDWAVLSLYALGAVVVALGLARRGAGSRSGEEYILAGRRLPWWVIGVADVATSDGADAFWLYVFSSAGFIGYHRFFWISSVVAMPVGVLWARYWRRLRLASPGQLIEERYGGAAAAGLRAVSSLYGALVTGGVLLGYVLRGFAQSLAPFLGWPDDLVLVVFSGGALAYTLLSGLLAVAYADLAHFAFLMAGRLLLALLLLHAAGGLGAALDAVERIRGPAFLRPYPPSPAGADFGAFAVDPLSLAALLFMGALSGAGGQGANVQKSLAARDEWHAAVGQVWASALSLVLRVLPLALIGIAAVALLPAGRTDADLWADLVRRHVPAGLLGLLLCGVISGYVSTIVGLVSFGAAGLLNDLYRRHLRPTAGERAQVAFGRAATVAVVLVAYLWARVLIAKVDAAWINFINSVAGLAMLPLALLRWLWWRATVAAEIVGFVAAFPLAYLVWFGVPGLLPGLAPRPYWQTFLLLCGLGLALGVFVSLLTRPASPEVLRRFCQRARPPGFWGRWRAAPQGGAPGPELRNDLLTAGSGVVLASSLTVGMGALLGRRFPLGLGCAALAAASAWAFVRLTVRGERLRAGLD